MSSLCITPRRDAYDPTLLIWLVCFPFPFVYPLCITFSLWSLLLLTKHSHVQLGIYHASKLFFSTPGHIFTMRLATNHVFEDLGHNPRFLHLTSVNREDPGTSAMSWLVTMICWSKKLRPRNPINIMTDLSLVTRKIWSSDYQEPLKRHLQNANNVNNIRD